MASENLKLGKLNKLSVVTRFMQLANSYGLQRAKPYQNV